MVKKKIYRSYCKVLVFLLLLWMANSPHAYGQILQLDLGQSAAKSRVIEGNPRHVRDVLPTMETYGFTIGYRPKDAAEHAIYFTTVIESASVWIHLEEDGAMVYDDGRHSHISGNGRGHSYLYGLGYGYSLWTRKRRLTFEPVAYLHVQHAVETKYPGFAREWQYPVRQKYTTQFFNRFHEGVQVIPAIGFNAGLRLLGGLSLQVTARIRYAYRTVASGEVDYWVWDEYQEQAKYQSNPTGYYLGLSVRYDWQWKKGM